MLLFLPLLLLMIGTCSSNPVVLIVLDGFRPDYFLNRTTPNLDKLATTGLLASNVTPTFPASDLPNLASMITGFYADKHGVLDEEVYDPVSEKIIHPSQDVFWNRTKAVGTIWELLRQNKDGPKNSGSINWPGMSLLLDNFEQVKYWPSEEPNDDKDDENKDRRKRSAKDEGKQEDKEDNTEDEDKKDEHKDDSEDNSDAGVDTAITDEEDWPKLLSIMQEWQGTFHPEFIAIHLGEPARAARIFGTDNKHVDEAIRRVDDFVGSVVEMVGDEANVIVTGTPGLVDIHQNHVVDLTSLVSKEKYTRVGKSPVINIKPEGSDDDVLDVYTSLLKGPSDVKYTVYYKHGLPDAWHYSGSDRVQPIVLVAKEGYVFAEDFFHEMTRRNKVGNRSQDFNNTYGYSGYNNSLPSMQTVLIASGPAFKKGQEVQGVRTVDVLPLLCHCLDIQVPTDRDGRIDVFAEHLEYPPNATTFAVVKHVFHYLTGKEHLPTTVAVLAASIIIVIASVCIVCIKKRNKKNPNITYRYTQVKNRRYDDEPQTADNCLAEDDKQGLLTSTEDA